MDAQTEIVETDSSPFGQSFGKKPLLNNNKKKTYKQFPIAAGWQPL